MYPGEPHAGAWDPLQALAAAGAGHIAAGTRTVPSVRVIRTRLGVGDSQGESGMRVEEDGVAWPALGGGKPGGWCPG
jgi:hypothetical protein